MANKNTNCLSGFRCPKCLSYEPFNIEIVTMARVIDDGVEEYLGDNTWNDKSYCSCTSCGIEGTVFDFQEKRKAKRG